MSNKLSGKSGSFTFNGQVLAFQKISPSIDRKLGDTTDSDDYDQATDMIYPSQVPISLQTKIDVEGRFNLQTTNAKLLVPLYSGATAVPVIVNITPTVVFGHGNFDVSNFSMEEPVDDIVTWKASMQSNGKFTVGS